MESYQQQQQPIIQIINNNNISNNNNENTTNKQQILEPIFPQNITNTNTLSFNQNDIRKKSFVQTLNINNNNFGNISETLSSLIMSRPQTHQMLNKPHNNINNNIPIKNIKTLQRIQSVEPKNFMSQRQQLQTSGQKTQTHKLLKLRTDTLSQQSPQSQTISSQQQQYDSTNNKLSTQSRLQSLSRGNMNIQSEFQFPQQYSAISRGTTSGSIGQDPMNGGYSSLRLDLQKLNEYKSLIDQKDRTITDLRNKLKVNESKISLGATNIMLKSNLMKADSLMNFRLNEHTDISELKRTLITLISETQQTNETLLLRSNKLREMLDLYEARIQFDDMLFLKERDVARMNEHIKHLTDSLVNASKNELLFNEKVREMAKCKHDFAMTKSRNEFLERQNSLLNQEVKDLKHQMVNMKELEMQMNKQRIADQNSLQVMTRRLDTLEKGLEVFQDNKKSLNRDDEYKLKNTVNFLIRETQELKKDIQLKKKTIEGKDREIQKLVSKIQKFLSQKNEEGLDSDDDFGQEQIGYAKDKIGQDLQQYETATAGSQMSLNLHNLDDANNNTIRGNIFNSHLPQVNKYQGNSANETKKNLEYRFKTMSSTDKETLTELIESGSSFFVDYLINKGDIVQVKDKFKMICEQLLKSNKFIDKLNYLIHLPYQLIKKNDEQSIIQQISQDSLHLLDKPQRITLWIRDTLNNELWTYIGDKRLQVGCQQCGDVIGVCCQKEQSIAIPNVKEWHGYDPDYENMFQEIDPYGYKERQFVLAIPVKHPRTNLLLGVLEICLLKQATLDDYFMSDGLAQLCGMLLSRFQESRSNLKQTMNLKKIVDKAKILIDSASQSEIMISQQIENVIKDMFGILQCRFIYVKDNQSIWYSGDLKSNNDDCQKSSQNSLALEVAQQKIGLIYGQPQQEKNFNGNIDISTNLPLVCYPIFDYSHLAEKKVLGVIEIPQPQLRFNAQTSSQMKQMIIDEIMKESLDSLSKLISQVIAKK